MPAARGDDAIKAGPLKRQVVAIRNLVRNILRTVARRRPRNHDGLAVDRELPFATPGQVIDVMSVKSATDIKKHPWPGCQERLDKIGLPLTSQAEAVMAQLPRCFAVLPS
jgi:hypothetical protein